MAEQIKLNRPWLIAVWPGMGHVAISAGYYLVAKLGMHLMAEFSARDLFEVDHVEIKSGLIRTGRLPRNRLFAWKDPENRHDLVVFIGEAQPASGKWVFCNQLIDHARELGVERVMTFAAMATQMHPEQATRVFGAATDKEGLAELEQLKVEVLNDGHIGGLNGVLLGAAAEQGLPGACLLGEMPQVLAQLPFPKASLAVLKVFTMLAQIDLDTEELSQQARAMDERLGDLLTDIEQAIEEGQAADDELESETSSDQPTAEDELHIEKLFDAARRDRSRAYELKRELDRLGIFAEFEDRFLDLFKDSD